MTPPSPAKRLAFISYLRFPLAALVVLIHSNISAYFTLPAEQTETARRVIHGISVGITSFAVPLFFAISGYLFYYGLRDFTFATYTKKLKHRIKSLLIPYVLWCLIAFLLYAGISILKGEPLTWPFSLDVWWGIRLFIPGYECLLGYQISPVTAPLHVPLWFVRDLILLDLLSPVIHFMLKRMGWAFIVIVGILFYVHLYPNWGGVSLKGLLYFCFGAIWAIQGKNPLEATRRWLPSARITALIFLLAYAVLWEKVHWAITDTFNMIYVWSAMIATIHWAENASHKHPIPKMLSQSGFFVYAVHTLFLFVILKPMALHVQDRGLAVILAAYLGCFAATLLLSVLSFRIVAWAEHGYGLLTGIWRKQTK